MAGGVVVAPDYGVALSAQILDVSGPGPVVVLVTDSLYKPENGAGTFSFLIRISILAVEFF